MTITRHRDTTPAIDAEEVFRFLGYDPRDPAARAVVGLCVRYELDPFAGHIIVIPGRRSPYVTRDGHLWLAHRSGQFDGMETLEEWATDKNAYAKVAVWRRDMSHPFVYNGRCPLKNQRGGWDENADKKAVANAEVRALKRAFPLQLPSIVDYEDDLDSSGAGLRDAPDGGGDAPSGSPAPDPTSEMARGGARTTDILAGASGAATPGPNAGTGEARPGPHVARPGSPSPSAPKQEEPSGVARSGAEGANHDPSKPGAGASPPDATRPPDGSPPPGRPSGGTKGSRPAVSPGKAVAGRADPEQGERHR